MSLFRGYAQQKGFKPIKVENPADKIAAQGQRQLRQMQAALSFNQQQSDRLVSAMRSNSRIELDNMKANFQARQHYADVMAKAKWKQFETEIERQNQVNKREQELVKSLLQFTATGTKLYQQWNQKRQEDASAFARQLEDDGIGVDKWNQIKNIKDYLWEDEGRKAGALNEIGLDGVSPESIEQARNASGYQTIAIQELGALRKARMLKEVISDAIHEGVQFPIGPNGLEVSWGTANPEARLEWLKKVIQKHSLTDPNWPSAKIWESSGAWKTKEQIISGFLDNAYAADRKAEQSPDQTYRRVWMKIDHSVQSFDPETIGATGLQGYFKAILNEAGHTDKTEATPSNMVNSARRAADALVWALDKGNANPLDYIGLEDFEVQLPGKTGPGKGGLIRYEKWRPADADRIVAARNRALNKLENKMHQGIQSAKREEKQFILDVTEAVLTTKSDPKSLLASLKVAADNDWHIASAKIRHLLSNHTTPLNDDYGLAEVQQRITNDEIILPSELEALKMSEGATQQAMALYQAKSKYYPSADEEEHIKGWIDSTLLEVIPAGQRGNLNRTHKPTSDEGVRLARGYYFDAKSKGEPASRALKYARDMIAKDMADPKGFAGVVSRGRGKRGFRFGMADPNVKPIGESPQELLNNITADPKYFYKNIVLDETDTEKYINDIIDGKQVKSLPALESIHSITGVPSLKTLLAQRELINNKREKNGETLLPEIPKDFIAKNQEIERKIDPKWSWLLSCTDYSAINKASCKSGGETLYIQPQVEGAREFAKTRSKGDYDSVGGGFLESPASIYLGYSIQNATLEEVLQVLDKGDLDHVGAYSITADQLRTALRVKDIYLGTKFTPQVQDRLFEIILKSGTYQAPEDLPPLEAAALEDQARIIQTGKLISYHDLGAVRKEVLHLFGGDYVGTVG